MNRINIMTKYMVTLGLSLFLAAVASAHHNSAVNIHHADKVIVETGASHHTKTKMMKCLLTLKKYTKMEDAMKDARAKIDSKCEMYKIDSKKCDHMKRKVAVGLYKCFTAREFLQSFFGRDKEDSMEAPPAAVKTETPPVAVVPTPAGENK
jgi:hypothetical protein